MRYCVIIYVGHFWPPYFCPILALYAEFPAFYADIFLPSSTVSVTHVAG